ncbi:MAG: hypothetical protein KDD66_05685 [Bdellovibrionales bacterium]|nr:hypothetical protein [Bdellovibrionales bacterium]
MKLDNLGVLLITNNRSRAYLQRMVHHRLLPAFAILLDNSPGGMLPGQTSADVSPADTREASCAAASDRFQLNSETLQRTLERLEIPFTLVSSSNPNDKVVTDALRARSESYWVYSGPGGAILSKSTLSIGKSFIHVHPGIVPRYRGSTTLYYSLLESGSCGASAIFLSADIDAGGVIATKEFPPPADRREIDYLYDPLIRSELLVDVLKQYARNGSFNCTTQSGPAQTYYIMHPLLRHICILSNRPLSGHGANGQ